MRTLHIDLETYSSVDIKKAGLYKYVQSPDFQILLFAYVSRSIWRVLISPSPLLVPWACLLSGLPSAMRAAGTRYSSAAGLPAAAGTLHSPAESPVAAGILRTPHGRIAAMLGDPEVTKVAHNAAFEIYCLNRRFHSPVCQWHCTMVHALYCGPPSPPPC